MVRFFGFLFIFLQLTGLARAEPFQTTANRVLLFDEASGAVLFEKNAQSSVGLAATAKIMTALVVVEALQAGEISLSTEYPVSEDSWRRGGGPSGGPSMFANLNSRIAVLDLLRGLMVQGGNDACLVLAEGIAGSEHAFVDRMNAVAAKIGLSHTRFANVTGKADDAQKTTLQDTSRLAAYFQKTHSAWYKIYSEKEFTWNGIRQLNRNPLIAAFPGTDGLAAGSSDTGSFDLVISVKKDNRHFILVAEAHSAKERNEEAERLLSWAFDSFTSVMAFKAGAVVGEVRVFGGTSPTVPVAARHAIHAILPKESLPNLEGQILYQGPVPAPVKAGDAIGVLRLKSEGKTVSETPVIAVLDVPKGGFFRRAVDAVIELGVGLVRGGENHS